MIEYTGKQRYVGRIFSVMPNAALKNGAIVGLGTQNADGTFNAVDPVTADLADTSYYILNQDEYNYREGFKVGDWENEVGIPAKALPLVKDVTIKIPASMVSGTAVDEQFLIPADGTNLLTAAADLTGNTKLALRVLDDSAILKQDGSRVDAVKAIVIQG